jgi:hypothetical protein
MFFDNSISLLISLTFFNANKIFIIRRRNIPSIFSRFIVVSGITNKIRKVLNFIEMISIKN